MSTIRIPSAVNSIPANYNQSESTSYSSLSNNSYANQNTTHPIHPDVRMKMLPFFDIHSEILKPCTLAPGRSGRYEEASFSFSLTPQQAEMISHSRDMRPDKEKCLVQIQLRFCLLETTCEQEDKFPPNLDLKINDKTCQLPITIPTHKAGEEPKMLSMPVNITHLCKISPTVSNRILVTWSSEYGRCYVISGYLVKKLNSEDLLRRLKTKRPLLADVTISLIKQKLREDEECELVLSHLRCSLLCPIGKIRMLLPCRAETCSHLQCFDASLYLQMNERKPTWICPVCDKAVNYENLVIDGYFQEVLQANSTCSEVSLHKDGSWTPLLPKKESKKKKSKVTVETISDDSDDENLAANKDDSVVEVVRNKRKTRDVEIITLTDFEDEAHVPKKAARCKSTETDVSYMGPLGAVSSQSASDDTTDNSVDSSQNIYVD